MATTLAARARHRAGEPRRRLACPGVGKRTICDAAGAFARQRTTSSRTSSPCVCPDANVSVVHVDVACNGSRQSDSRMVQSTSVRSRVQELPDAARLDGLEANARLSYAWGTHGRRVGRGPPFSQLTIQSRHSRRGMRMHRLADRERCDFVRGYRRLITQPMSRCRDYLAQRSSSKEQAANVPTPHTVGGRLRSRTSST
jgi:hypothetical protein